MYGNILWIIFCVNDFLIAKKEGDINNPVKFLEKEYEIKNLSEINYYLRIYIQRTEEGGYALDQENKIDEIQLKWLKAMRNSNDTWMSLENEENFLPENTQYKQAVGALLYIATTSRLDICAAVNILNSRN